MNLDKFFIWALVTFLISLVFFFIDLKIRYKRNKILAKIITPINILLCGTAVSSAILFYPVYCNHLDLGWFESTLASIQHSFRLFAVDGEYAGFIETIDGLYTKNIFTRAQADKYVTFCTVLYVFAPILTFTVLLSFFKNAFSHVRYRLVAFYQTTHIFSELNEKSLALAKSIADRDCAERSKHWLLSRLCALFPKNVIVFTDVIDAKEEESYELLEEARELGAILFRKDLDSIKLIRRYEPHRRIKVYLISENENEKIRHATTVMTQYDMPNVELYVFSEKVQSRLILGVKSIKNMKVVRVNDIQNLIYHNLDTYGKRLFDNAKDRHISAVIVGFGMYGKELLKTLSWFCCYPGFKLTVDVFDSNKNAESSFKLLCPEMIEVSEREAEIEGDSNYKIRFHCGVDINSCEFKESFNKIQAPTYIFVSLGNDSDNIETALNIRTLCAQRGISPDIETVVYDSNSARLMSCVWAPDAEPQYTRYGKNEKAEKHDDKTSTIETTEKAFNGVENYKGQCYDIHMIGDLDSFYSCDTVIAARWEKEGELINRRFCGVTDKSSDEERYAADRSFWQYEYNYKSSVSKAIHERLKYKLNDTEYRADLPFMSTPIADWTDEEKLEYSKLEHPRWNAYMRSEGYSGSKERYDLAKRHSLIITNDELTKKDEADGTTKRLDDAI